MSNLTTNHLAKSQDPYHSDYQAMGLAQSVWDLKRPPVAQVELTAADKERAYQRAYAKKKYVPVAERVAIILRDNSGTFALDSASDADKAKQARLLGKPNSRRSQ